MTEPGDLIKKCIAKDQRAEYALYKKYFNTLMRICWRYTKSEDDAASLLNKGFLKILLNLEKYDTAQPFESWIKTIMIHTIIDEFRMGKARNELMETRDMDEIATHLHPVDINIAEQKMGIDEIVGEINKLPEQEMRVFNLYVFDGLSHEEIGKSLKMPAGTSRYHLSNARSMLKKRLLKFLYAMKTMVLC